MVTRKPSEALSQSEFLQPPEVLFADQFNRPVFQMGPYDNQALALNFELARAQVHTPKVDWSPYCGNAGCYTLTRNGREAICLAVADLQLAGQDEVLIETTSGSPYVSRCVTDSISRFCRWSRCFSERTRAIVVIHEFGFPARLSEESASSGLPVIEDCAYALGSQNADGTIGNLGDYVVFSFSKALPVPYGGMLKSRQPLARPSELSASGALQLPRLLAHHLKSLGLACRRRRELFEQYRVRFSSEGFGPLFEPGPAVVPHSFVVALADQSKAEAMKPRLNSAGIISSVFYGGGGYFLPNHQSLSQAAIEYIVAHFVTAFNQA